MVILTSLEDVERLVRGEELVEHFESSKLTFNCLLPNGAYLECMEFARDHTIREVKKLIWKRAVKRKLNHNLPDQRSCIISYISSHAKTMLVTDEDCRISSIQPVLSELIVKHNGMPLSEEEKQRAAIDNLISGDQPCPVELDSIDDEEVKDFLKGMTAKCKEWDELRLQKRDLNGRLFDYYCPDINRTTCKRNIGNVPPNVDISVMSKSIRGNRAHLQKCHVHVLPNSTPENVIVEALKDLKYRDSEADNYVLKVAGIEEYLIQDEPARCLYDYNIIHSKLVKSEEIQLVLVLKADVANGIGNPLPKPRNSVNCQSIIQYKTPPTKWLWDLDESIRMKVGIKSVTNLKFEETDKLLQVQVIAFVYHGRHKLGCVATAVRTVSDNFEADFKENLEFNISVCNLPRMSKLCFVLYHPPESVQKPLKPIAWGNISLFDYKGRLAVGEKEMQMWPWHVTKETPAYADGLANYLETIINNPEKDESPKLNIVLMDEEYNQKPILYPTMEEVHEFVRNNIPDEISKKYDSKGAQDCIEKNLISRDRLQPMEENTQAEIWKLRYDISADPSNRDYLPHLLECVKWDDKIAVAEMYVLLRSWPSVSTETALQLLDCNYPDLKVREFAVDHLRTAKLSCSELKLYMLQLVQAVKFEPYLNCPLVEFLLEYAVKNRKIGNHFFWLLRSEMQKPSVSVKFGLIIKAYLAGASDQIPIMIKQVAALNCLKEMNKKVVPITKTKRDVELRSLLEHNKDHLCILVSPLNPAWLLHDLLSEKCKVKGSKKKPLHLVWSHPELPEKKHHEIIFKTEDDLRQDMLSLQILNLMNSIWKEAGLDLMVVVYECLASDLNVGMLEVVQESETIASIQKEYGGANCIKDWLSKKSDKNKEAEMAAYETFAKSCAGYCVSSYVLGLGDRHNDNIMIKESGQIFNIDFGHILGDYKKIGKIAVRRDRGPFVFTQHFHAVITASKLGYKGFKDLCLEAFLALRKKGDLILSMFMMMRASGLPNLSSDRGVKHVQDALGLQLNETDAKKMFLDQYLTAQNVLNCTGNAINWQIHSFKHR